MKSLFVLFFVSLLIADPKYASAETIYPRFGSLSSSTSETASFVQFTCTADKPNKALFCSKTHTKIQPNSEPQTYKQTEGLVRSEIESGALSVSDIAAQCRKLDFAFKFLEGETINGRTLTPQQRKELQSSLLRQGMGETFMLDIQKVCKNTTLENVIEFMHLTNIAESQACNVSTVHLPNEDEPYELEPVTGTFIWSGVVDGFCDQYIYTEVIYPGQFRTIEKYEEKWKFVQQLKKGEERAKFDCDAKRIYEDETFTVERVFYPTSCVSLTSK